MTALESKVENVYKSKMKNKNLFEVFDTSSASSMKVY